MSRGRIGRASRRYPDARRRALRYGQTLAGRRANGMPPHLLPGVSARKADNKAGLRLGIAIGLAALLAVSFAVTLVLTAISTAAAVGGTVTAYRQVNDSLPDAALVSAETFQTTRIFDRNGELLQEIADPNYGGWRTFVTLDQVSQDAIDATVAAEDATFWTHPGIEPVAIARGFVITLGGRGTSGASTITQQLVRSLHPERIGTEVTYSRKFKEMLAAVAVERQFTKSDILTMYLNLIFYGNRSYGIEAAALTYYHKHASELTLSEATLLAGIPQQPTNFNPSLYPENAKERQKYVLNQMVKLGYITRAEADAAYREFPRPHATREGDGAVRDHDHFVEYVKFYVEEKWGSRALLYGGLNIYTTIDKAVQVRAEDVLRTKVDTELQYYQAHNAAMVIMVPYTGEILAMVGSADFYRNDIAGQVNVTTSLQQPGSAIKPIVYAAAFEQGWHPGTIVLDAPFRQENPPGSVDAQGKPDPYYEPQNYLGTFNGAVTVRKALSNSLNIPAVKAAQFIGGPAAVIEMARRMGIKHGLNQPIEDYGLSIALGAGDVWPLELTNAYATIANNGKYVPANPIMKITDSQGRTLYEIDRKRSLQDAQQVIRPEIAYQLTSILTDDEARSIDFGRGNLFGATQQELGRPTAAKSGTTNDWRDIWTLGYTTDVAIGVWVGNTLNEPLAKIDGIQGAGPIWATMMREMHSNQEFAKLLNGPDGQPLPREFARPPGIVEGIVCEATGGRPTENSGNRRELLVQGGPPAQRCDQLSAWQVMDLAGTLKTMRERGGSFSGGGADSIYRYARAAGINEGGGAPSFVPPDPPRRE